MAEKSSTAQGSQEETEYCTCGKSHSGPQNESCYTIVERKLSPVARDNFLSRSDRFGKIDLNQPKESKVINSKPGPTPRFI